MPASSRTLEAGDDEHAADIARRLEAVASSDELSRDGEFRSADSPPILGGF